MRVAELKADHVEDVATVLARVHGRLPAAGPPSILADRNTAERAVAEVVGSGPGIVAFDGSNVVGHFIAPLPNVPGPGGSRLRPAHHAAAPEQSRAIYRMMYAAIAGQLVAAGCMYHSVPVPASEQDALVTWFELEFGGRPD